MSERPKEDVGTDMPGGTTAPIHWKEHEPDVLESRCQVCHRVVPTSQVQDGKCQRCAAKALLTR